MTFDVKNFEQSYKYLGLGVDVRKYYNKRNIRVCCYVVDQIGLSKVSLLFTN